MLPNALPHVKAGKVKAYMITDDASASPAHRTC